MKRILKLITILGLVLPLTPIKAAVPDNITSITVQTTTSNNDYADMNGKVYATILFNDGSSFRSQIHTDFDDFEKGATDIFVLTLDDATKTKTIGDIKSFSIQTYENDAWLLKKAKLVVNGLTIFENNNINILLSTDIEEGFDTWSATTVYGPIIGGLNHTSAKISYVVGCDAFYRLKVYQNSMLVDDSQIIFVNSTKTFTVTNLTPNTQYQVRLFRKHIDGSEVPCDINGTFGSFTTFPDPTNASNLTFAMGSCTRRTEDNASPAIWDAIRQIPGLRFFVYNGDTHYFYDDNKVAGQYDAEHNQGDINQVTTVPDIAIAGHMYMRTIPKFLSAAQNLPIYSMWDDHDFRGNDKTGSDFDDRSTVASIWRTYWPFDDGFGDGNNNVDRSTITSRISFGKDYDIYILDGRYHRSSSAVFGWNEQLAGIINDMKQRGPDKIRILISGSTWITRNQGDGYGNSSFDTERLRFYDSLASLVSTKKVKGFVLLSGDVHRFEENLVYLKAGVSVKEFVSSPMTSKNANDGPVTPKSPDQTIWYNKDKKGFAVFNFTRLNYDLKLKVNFYDQTGVSFRTTEYTVYDGLDAVISGATYQSACKTLTYSVNVSGGSGNISYLWSNGATTQSTTYYVCSPGTEVSVRVTRGNEQITAEQWVTVPGGGGCDVPINISNDNSLSKSFATTSVPCLSKVEGKEQLVPDNFFLDQNYPNPFNPSTTISFAIPSPSNTTINIYNTNGQLVRTLFGHFLEAGYYNAFWDGNSDSGQQVSSGIYIYRLQAGKFVQSKKMTLIK